MILEIRVLPKHPNSDDNPANNRHIPNVCFRQALLNIQKKFYLTIYSYMVTENINLKQS